MRETFDEIKAVNDRSNAFSEFIRICNSFIEFPNIGPEEVPNDDVLNDLPNHLGNCALQLGVELGITIDSIEETKTDYRTMYGQTVDILRKWRNSTEEKPTIYRLMAVLERIHLGGFKFLKDTYLSK